MTIDTLGHVVPAVRKVAVRSGPPTSDELRVHYPAHFTWPQLKTFVNSGDLGLLKRDNKLQSRYNEWAVGIKEEYGSLVNYLVTHRLRWGKPDTLSLLTSAFNDQPVAATELGEREPHIPPEYFKADIPLHSELICIIRNDWPYSVPPEIEHSLIWSRVPVFHPALIPSAIEARVQQHGLWGFTGSRDTTESLLSLESCLPVLADWGVTMDKLVRSARGNEAEEAMVESAGREVHEFVKQRWKERQWETAWFVNPPRLQSILDLAHIHVFARRKTAEEEAAWSSWSSAYQDTAIISQ